MAKQRKTKQRGGSVATTASPEAQGVPNNFWMGVVIGIIVLALVVIIIYLVIQTQKAGGAEAAAVATEKSVEKLSDMLAAAGAPVPPARTGVAHPELAGHRIVVDDADNPRRMSYWDYLNMKDHERVVNPLLPPERSYENTYGIPINIPSRGFSGGFQQVGTLYKNAVTDEARQPGNNAESVIMPLYGRPLYPGANKWNYYVTSDKYNMVKMPFRYQGKMTDDQYGVNELMDGDAIQLPEYNGDFVVKIYQYDKPRYIPFIY